MSDRVSEAMVELREKIEHILSPAIDPRVPYAKVMIDHLAELLAPGSQAGEWRDITSAPRGTKHVLMFGDGIGFMQCAFIGNWVNDRWQETFSNAEAMPIAWMPLPPPPEREGT